MSEQRDRIVSLRIYEDELRFLIYCLNKKISRDNQGLRLPLLQYLRNVLIEAEEKEVENEN